MKKMLRPLTGLLSAALLTGLAGCGLTKDDIMSVVAPTEPPEVGAGVVHVEVAQTQELPAVQEVYETLTGCFSPFWATADGDLAVVKATQIPLLAESGAQTPVTVKTETLEDNRFRVDIALDAGVKFFDGREVTADDLIFTYYALLDADYTGPLKVNTLPIAGLREYASGVPTALYEKYGALYDEIYDNGKYDEKLQKALKEAKEAEPANAYNEKKAQKALDDYDTDKAEEIKAAILASWRQDAQELVSYFFENYRNIVEYDTGYTHDEVAADKGLQVMFAMVETQVATLTKEGVLVGNKSGDTWDLASERPDAEDFYNELYASYGGDPVFYWQIEGIGRYDMFTRARDGVIAAWAMQDKDWSGAVTHIAGIERVSDTEISVTLEYNDAGYMSTLCAAWIAPLHWYGSEALYDYDAGSFGFDAGDLSALRARDETPLGAGEFALTSWADGVAHLTANGNYWSDAPENPRLDITTELFAS